MAIARVIVDQGGYAEVDTHMSAQGFATWIVAKVGDKERLYRLPKGTYWMAEVTDADDLLQRCEAACKAAGVVSAQILITSGDTKWRGLPLINGD